MPNPDECPQTARAASFVGSQTVPQAMRNPLWTVTSFYNPVRYKNRLKNFRIFRKRLQTPLVAVELSYQDDFELGPGDADILIQIRGQDVLWQKERLLNVGLQAVPETCDKVAWIDCDVVCSGAIGRRRPPQALDDAPLIQLFTARYNLPRHALPETVSDLKPYHLGSSAAHKLAEGLVLPAVLGRSPIVDTCGCSLGLAWAGRKELLHEHGLYDAGIVGGGDRRSICAAFAQFDGLDQPWMVNNRQRQHFQAWAKPFYAAVRGNVGYISGKLYHLWHGDKKDRNYLTRYEGFRQFNFDPFEDIAVSAAGDWQWNSDKPAMHEYLRQYFALRNEDGTRRAA